MSSALAGIRTNLARMDASASRVASQTADPATELVDQLHIKASFQANVAVLATVLDMDRSAIRLWA
jgi:flagellar basal body rod protein FlgC